ANLRSGPSTSTTIVGKVEQGKTLEVIETSGAWIKVRSSGLAGWISDALVERIAETSDAPAFSPGASAASARTPAPQASSIRYRERGASSDEKTISVGVGASLGDHDYGFAADGRVMLAPVKSMPNLRIMAAMDFFFKEGRGWILTGSGMYVIRTLSEDIHPYLGAGIAIAHAGGESEAKPDIGGGVEIKRRIFAEGRFILSDPAVLIVSAGVKF
ncbi:MAG: SH3 domain-containing protein, partial [Vicinamibacteria bacterium]|nr:SH3 domain-containing protein [Vicinamibacteria bacterium]